MPTQPPPTAIPFNTLRNIPVPIQAICEAGLSPTQWVLLYIIHHPELRPELLAMCNCENKPRLWTESDIEDVYQRRYLRRNPVQTPGLSSTDAFNLHTTKLFADLLNTVKQAWLPKPV